MNATMHPISEMGRYIRGSINLARAARKFGELLGWEAAEDIQQEAVAHERKIAGMAYSAEQGDREALKLLEATAADGHIDAEEMAAVTLAIRHIRRSAEQDRRISEAARV